MDMDNVNKVNLINIYWCMETEKSNKYVYKEERLLKKKSQYVFKK